MACRYLGGNGSCSQHLGYVAHRDIATVIGTRLNFASYASNTSAELFLKVRGTGGKFLRQCFVSVFFKWAAKCIVTTCAQFSDCGCSSVSIIHALMWDYRLTSCSSGVTVCATLILHWKTSKHCAEKLSACICFLIVKPACWHSVLELGHDLDAFGRQCK